MDHSGRIGLKRTSFLKRANLVRPLFDRSRADVKSVSAGCVRIIYRPVSREELVADVVVQAVFVVSRRTGNAVMRNRIRRIMRDVYRRGLPSVDSVVRSSGVAQTLVLLFRGAPGDIKTRLAADLQTALAVLTARLGEAQPTHHTLERTSGS